MNWLLSVLVALLTGAGGLFLGFFVGTLNVRWYRISSFEGGSGYYCAMLGLLGGVVGLVVGFVASRLVAATAEPSFLKGLGAAAGGLVGLAGVVTLLCWLAADLAPTMDGKSLQLAIEVKAPRRFTPQFAHEDGFPPRAYLENGAGKTMDSSDIDLAQARQVDGRWVIPAMLDLRTASSGKRVRAYFNKQLDAFVTLPLRGHPRKADLEWSDWRESAWNANQPRPSADEAFFVRYKVLVVEPPPPAPPPTDEEARRLAEEQAEFDAMKPDAPVAEWLRYTVPGTPDERLHLAVVNLQGREDLAPELGALMNGDDHELAQKALLAIARFEVYQPELSPQVAAAGRKIAALIRTFNETPVEQDPSMQAAADVAFRFHGWIEAARTLRQHAEGDFVPELQEILTLSRVRTDSHCMQADVRRVASYCLKEWAGVAPWPGDPPPR